VVVVVVEVGVDSQSEMGGVVGSAGVGYPNEAVGAAAVTLVHVVGVVAWMIVHVVPLLLVLLVVEAVVGTQKQRAVVVVAVVVHEKVVMVQDLKWMIAMMVVGDYWMQSEGLRQRGLG
jgi:hypothetical protein